jgi:hypothetical protein
MSCNFLRVTMVCVAGIGLACAPKARSLPGAPTPARLPAAQLAPGYQRVDFRWEFVERDLAARGEGVARIASPDSARVDLFLDGGYGGGWALLIGDRLITPQGAGFMRRYIPPPALLWAAFGRLAIPPAADTAARREGNTLRADIGSGPTWRVTFDGDRLARLERIDGGRIVERVARLADGSATYRNDGARRSLVLRVTGMRGVPGFDAAIWRP